MAKGKYKEWLSKEGLIKVEGWARDGLTNEQIAHNMGIAEGTLYEYIKKYPKINEVLKRGKEVVDREVENALLNEAKKGNVTAIIFWLKNRKPKQWRDKQDVQFNENEGIQIKINTNSKGSKLDE